MGDGKVLQRTSRNVLPQTEVAVSVTPAPFIFGATLMLGVWLDNQAWIGLVGSIPRPIRAAVALGLIGLGVWLLAQAISSFRRADTPFVPYAPTRALVVGSIFSKSRNPMYQAMALLTAGLGMLLRSDWTLLLLIPAALIVHYKLVKSEEHYLERKFGADYQRYKEQVPRYGWRLLSRRPAEDRALPR